MSSCFVNLSYKQLQGIAKELKIPANFKRAILVNALEAYRDDKFDTLTSIIDFNKSIRKRCYINKPKNLTMKKKRKSNVKQNSKRIKIVDSVPIELKDTLLSNHKQMNPGIVNNTNTQDRYAYLNRHYTNQHYFSDQMISDFPYFNSSMNTSSPYIANNVHQAAPNSAVITSFSSMSKPSLQQDLSHGNGASLYQQPSFAQEYSVNNFNTACNFYSEDYAALQQYPLNAKPYEINSLSSDLNVGVNQIKSLVNPYYAKPSGSQTPSIEVDCPSYLLPNIPQLGTTTSNGNSACVTWSQNSVIPNNSLREEHFRHCITMPKDSSEAYLSSTIQDRYSCTNHHSNQHYFNEFPIISDSAHSTTTDNTNIIGSNYCETSSQLALPLIQKTYSQQNNSCSYFPDNGTTTQQSQQQQLPTFTVENSSNTSTSNLNTTNYNNHSYSQENCAIPQYSSSARYEMNYSQSSSYNFHDTQMKISSSLYYTKTINNQNPAIEVDCSSYLLPNIPQLNVNSTENTSSCNPSCQNTFVPNISVSVRKNNGSRNVQGKHISNKSVRDNTSAIDKTCIIEIDNINIGSDDETVSISDEEVISLLDSDDSGYKLTKKIKYNANYDNRSGNETSAITQTWDKFPER